MRWVVVATAVGIALGVVGIRARGSRGVPRVVALAGFVVAAFTAGFLAWVAAFAKPSPPTWEPTPRPGPQVS
jgi:hypothetical protein